MSLDENVMEPEVADASQANTLNLILKWSEELSEWQSDVLRRLIVQPEISQEDINDICEQLKLGQGISTVKKNLKKLTSKDIPSVQSQESKVVLKSMHSVKNVNALAAGQTLQFKEQGLTIIYGANGSGKSGYARVLKRACRARDNKDTILPNVFDPLSTGGAEASFDVEVAGKGSATLRWKHGTDAPDELSSITVFDSRCARVYVDEENDVAYMPYGLEIFNGLSRLFEKVKENLEAEIRGINTDTTAFADLLNGVNAVGTFIKTITHKATAKDIERLSKLTDEELVQLESLRNKLLELQLKDPSVKIAELNQCKERIKRLRDSAEGIKAALSEGVIKNLKREFEEVESASEAAHVASRQSFKDEPLAGTGSDVWKRMFEAARKFSEEEAYKGKVFPVTEGEAHCLLCQQSLTLDAANRLKKFDTFVKDETAKILAEKRRSYQILYDQLVRTVSKPASYTPEMQSELNTINPVAATKLKAFIESAEKRHKEICDSPTTKNWTATALSETPLKELNELISKIEKDVSELEKVRNPEEKSKIQTEFNELDARKQLGAKTAVILEHIKKLERINALEECVRLVNTRFISLKASELTETLVTDRLKQSVKEELKSLGVEYLKINLDKKGRAGTAVHKFKLENVNLSRINVSDVMSEGEQKAIAIASFLAELSTSASACGIVLDDPVSSLDHVIRDRVAERLVLEAQKRQVVIFTHDLAFLVALETSAEKLSLPHTIQTVWANPSVGTGHCDSNVPWDGQRVKRRIGYLRDTLVKIKKAFKESKKEEIEERTERFYKRLRETWERVIEEKVFCDVVKRFRYGIQTQSLKGVSFADEDFKLIDAAMTRASNAVHDQSPERNYVQPSEKEMEADLKNLEDYVASLEKRSEETKSKR